MITGSLNNNNNNNNDNNDDDTSTCIPKENELAPAATSGAMFSDSSSAPKYVSRI